MGFFFNTNDADRCKKICKQATKGDAEKLVHYMKKHIDNPLFMSATCSTFNTMCMNPNHKDKLSRAGGVDLLCEIIRKHTGETGVQEPAIQALARIINKENRHQIASNGAVGLVIDAMTLMPNSVVIQEAGPSVLGSMAEEEEAVQDTIGKSGGVKVILAAINNHPRSPVVVRNGVNALYQIASLWKKNQLKIANEGGCKCIAEAVYRHYCDVRILAPGLKVLQMLAVAAENVAQISRENGVFTIVDTMCRHHDEAAIQQHGCYALGLLAKDVSIRPKISEEGGLASVITALKNHERDAGVQAGGCQALASLAKDNSMHKMEILREGGVRLILNAMKNHKDTEGVQAGACKAIAALATTQANKIRIADENAIQLILKCMNRFNRSASVVEEGCRAVINLASSNAANVRTAVENGGVACMNSCLEHHSHGDLLQDLCCEALNLLNGVITESSLNVSRSSGSSHSFHSQHDTNEARSSNSSEAASVSKSKGSSPSSNNNNYQSEAAAAAASASGFATAEPPEKKGHNFSLMSITSDDRLDTARDHIKTPRLEPSIDAGISPDDTQIEITPVKRFSFQDDTEALESAEGAATGNAHDMSLLSITTVDEGRDHGKNEIEMIDPEESQIEIVDDDDEEVAEHKTIEPQQNKENSSPKATPPKSFIKKVRGNGIMPRYVAASPGLVAKTLQLPAALTRKSPNKNSRKSPIPEEVDERFDDRSSLLRAAAV